MNKFQLLGRLTRDVELTKDKNGDPIAKSGIAVRRRSKDDDADFFNLVAFGKTATFFSDYFHKGDMACISGRIKVTPWEDSEGKKRVSFDVIIEEIHFTGSKKEERKSDAYESPSATDEDLPF
jgi:single-strand DNA-binding protein